MNKRLILVMTLFIISCTVSKKNTQMPEATSETVSVILDMTPTFEATVLATNRDMIVKLQCQPYLETTWGNSLTQWGPKNHDPSRSFYLLPLVFNSQTEIYFSDFGNKRLLKYDGSKTLPEQVISLQYFFEEENINSWPNQPHPPISLISIVQDKIYVPYGSNQIGILSLDGEIIDDIVIPSYHYNFMFPTIDFAWVDRKGNLYVFSNKLVVFRKGWENLEWKEIKGIPSRYFWKQYSVFGPVDTIGETNIVLYETDISGIFSEVRIIPIDTGSKKTASFFPLFGTDENGNAYISVASENFNERLYARYSLETGVRQVAQVPDSYFREDTSLVPSVSPDGTIYFVAYNDEDLSISPKIFKCRFPE